MGYAGVKLIYDALQKSAKTGGMDAKTAAIVLTIPPPPPPQPSPIVSAVFTIAATVILTPVVGVPLASAMSSAAVTAANGGDVKQIATNALTSYVATNPGLSTIQKLTASASIQLATGAKPEDVVRNVAATVAANSLTEGIPGVEQSKVITEVLGNINKNIAELAPDVIQNTVKSAMINAERQAVAASINGQDVVKNAIAGAGGGAVAQEVLYATDNKAIARAAAEYAQYKAAGYSDQAALTKSVQGFASEQAKTEAAAKIKQQTAGLSAEQVGVSQTYGQSAAFPTAQAGQFTGTEAGEKSLAKTYTDETTTPVGASLSTISSPGGFQGRVVSRGGELPERIVTAKESLPGGTTTGTAGEDLSVLTPDVATEKTAEKTPEQQRRDMILTSLINKQVDTPLYSNKVAQQSGPGTAALAQALRVGDVGAPIFGRDEEGKKAGWNLESLRYMGDVGA
jgi:hypothetical protein